MTHGLVTQAWALGIEVLRLSIWLVLLAALFVPVERLFALHPQAVLRKNVLADLGFYFLNSLLPGFILGLPMGLLAVSTHAAMPGVAATMEALPLWARLCLGLLIGELGAYWGHRLSHMIPFLWQFHAVHHDAEHMDWLVNTRSHPVDMVFTRLCTLAPLYALGLGSPAGLQESTVPLLVLVFGSVWGFFIHANVRWRLGALEHLVASPAFHHWHHVKEGPINRNFSSTLPWLDRVFGTYHLPRGQWPKSYGIKVFAPRRKSDPAEAPGAASAGDTAAHAS